MSVRQLSPTASILRSSRLFSLPPPLPRPAPDLNSVTNYYSDTATTPYPTHAAIETTQSSLSRGDWGLKRALPLKSTTKSSTPTIHINNIDSIDHITDFGSAADHSITLQKWQELDMPLSIHRSKRTTGDDLPQSHSAFDSAYDNTEVIANKRATDSTAERWKFKGPWLAGKTDGDFRAYVQKKIRTRKSAFRQYLTIQLQREKAIARRQKATEEGVDLSEHRKEETTVSTAELEAYIRQLRNREDILHKLIEDYLDLPRENGQNTKTQTPQYVQQGPPTTHPSAGLSYLRTGAHIYNHPILGPQENRAPVEGRVIVPQKTGNRKNPRALIGIAGVVGEDKRVFYNEKGRNEGGDERAAGVNTYDPDIAGGGKLWTQPARASIDPHGRIDFQLFRADNNAFNVAQGIYSEGSILPEAPIGNIKDQEVRDLSSSKRVNSRSSSGYGLEQEESMMKSGRPTPFLGPDDEAPPEALHQLLTTGELKRR